MSEIKYPTRCRIVDVDGMTYGKSNIPIRTPDISKSHIGKEGVAELIDELTVKITLDDGNIIYGYECWWIPIKGKVK